MNIREQLLKVHSKANNLLICKWIGQNPERFAMLMDAFLEEENRIVQRASWALSEIGINYPNLFLPHLDSMITSVENPIHAAVQRNVFKVLAENHISLNEEQEGRLLNLAFDLLVDPSIAIAIRVYCMQFIANLCECYPDLAIELRAIIEEGMEYGSAGFKSRGGKILKQLTAL